jgi:hypothetical protein
MPDMSDREFERLIKELKRFVSVWVIVWLICFS